MNLHGMSDDEKLARLEMISAMPGMAQLGAMVAAVIEDALNPVLEGRRKQSCLHLMDAANGWRTGTGLLPKGQQRALDRMAFLCVRHPDRLLCDEGGSPTGVSLGCANFHLAEEHADEIPARCFTCGEAIPEGLITPVFATILLHRPLTIYNSWNTDYHYLGQLHTLPFAYLCPRHKRQVDLPIRAAWPMSLEGVTPEDIIGA